MTIARRVRAALAVLAMTMTAGCEYELAYEVGSLLDAPEPKSWFVPDGHTVDIGYEVTQIIGTDMCNTGFGEGFSCWKYSLQDGAENPVLLANGQKEIWTTKVGDAGRFRLVRMNGVYVASMSVDL